MKNSIKDYHIGSGRVLKEDDTFINWADFLFNYTDAFGKLVVKDYKNVADIAAHYPQTPERLRLYLNGSEIKLQYGSNAKFEDKDDAWTLKPAAGDVMEFRTTERFRYVVNYILEASCAYGVNKSLADGDKLVVGYGEADLNNDMASANGWFWEWRGTATGTEVYLTTYRDGTLLDETEITPPKDLTTWIRTEDDINWYNVGNRVARQTYTVDGKQLNDIVGQTSIDDERGPSRGNFHFGYSIKAASTGLELDCGSIGINILGNIDPVFRVKESIETGGHSGGGNFEPLFAIRKAPKFENVFTNISDVSVLSVSTDADVDVLVVVVGEDETDIDEADWGAPADQNAYNSAIQSTTQITQFPDNTGTLQTSSATFGGYQIGVTNYRTTGTGSKTSTNRTSGVRKRALPDDGYIVFLAKTDTPITSIELDYETEQQF